MSTVVKDNQLAHRYELFDDGELVGVADYEISGDRMAVLHVEIVESRSNQGLGRTLVGSVFHDARSRDLYVLPMCSYARAVVARNRAQYLDLVPVDVRADFGLAI
jgi:predicted GNAT family acetyltransferase